MYTMIPARHVFDSFAPMFRDPFFRNVFDEQSPMMMHTDVRETEAGYVLEAEMPGITKENISLKIENDTLTIAAETAKETEETKERYLRRERRVGKMERSFNLEGIDQNNITADYINGVLTVNLPKVPEVKNETRTIAIGSGENE